MFSLSGGQISGSFELSYRGPFAVPALPELTSTVPQGQSAWTGTAGVYNGGSTTIEWTVPAGVTTISIVTVGGGSGGGNLGSPLGAGSGGGLAYGSCNVTAGSNITILVGNGGGAYISGGIYDTAAGGDSKVQIPAGTDVIAGYGGGAVSTSTSYGGSYYNSGMDASKPRGGGAGGNGACGSGTSIAGSGGGAGGYDSNGGNGGINGGGASTSNYSGGGGGYRNQGGGVGLLGQSAGGFAQSTINTAGYDGSGGGYGSGGGGAGTYVNPYTSYPKYGGSGGVRIVWGSNRQYPDPANVADVSTITWAPNSPRDMPGIVAWYDEKSFDDRRGIWYDRLGNTSISANVVGCALVTLAGGNGANTNLGAAISGTPASSITWPTGLISNTYTIFHVTRYSGSNKQRIYSTTGGFDWASGHINGAAGQFKHGSLLTGSDGSTDYYGTNWFVTTDQLNIGRTNGITRGTGSGLTTYPATLAINKYSTEKSDFQTTCLVVCSGEMTYGYYAALETWLRNYYGITS